VWLQDYPTYENSNKAHLLVQFRSRVFGLPSIEFGLQGGQDILKLLSLFENSRIRTDTGRRKLGRERIRYYVPPVNLRWEPARQKDEQSQ
jgi:hypothetical protein